MIGLTSKRLLLVGFVWTGWSASLGWAQEGTSSLVRVTGKVVPVSSEKDPDKRIGIAGARVKAINLDDNKLAREAETRTDGEYVLTLRPGKYKFFFCAEGYNEGVAEHKVTRNVDLRPVVLSLGNCSNQVALELEPRPDLGEILTGETIRNLPAMGGRVFVDLITLTPGVSGVSLDQSVATTDTDQGADQGFTLEDGRAELFAPKNPGNTSTPEYQPTVVPPADVGQSLGASVRLLARRGTNALHGNLSYSFRHGDLGLRDIFFLPGLNVFHEHLLGGGVGGPIQREKTFYYAAYDLQRYTSAADVSPVLQRDIGPINQRLLQLKLPPEDLSQEVYTADSDDVVLALDHLHSAKTNLGARYSFERLLSRSSNLYFSEGIAAPSNARDSVAQEHRLVVNGNYSPANALQAEFRFLVRRLAWKSRPAQPALINFEIPGTLLTGRQFDLPDADNETNVFLRGAVHYTRASHILHAGIELEWGHRVRMFRLADAGRAVLPSLADLLADPPRAVLFEIAGGGSEAALNSTYFAAFLQDSWHLASPVRLEWGVRYEFELLPSLVRRDWNNLQPRVSLIYTRGGTTIQAGYGVMFDRIPQGAILDQLLAGGVGLNPSLRPPVREVFSFVGEPAASSALQEFLQSGTVPPAPQMAWVVAKDFRTSYRQQATLSVVHEVRRGISATIGYNFIRGVALPTKVNINLQPAVKDPMGVDDFGFRFKDPRFAQIYEAQSVGNSFLHEAYATARINLARYVLLVGYRYGKQMDEPFGRIEPMNPQNRPEDRSLSTDNRSHRLWVSGRAQPSWAWGLEFSSTVLLQSGRPFNVLIGSDINHDGQPLTDRPVGIGRNTFIGPGLAEVGLRVARQFRSFDEKLTITPAVEVSNLLNRRNFVSLNTIVGQANLLLADPKVAFGSSKLPNLDFHTPLLPGTDFGVASQDNDPLRLRFRLSFRF